MRLAAFNSSDLGLSRNGVSPPGLRRRQERPEAIREDAAGLTQRLVHVSPGAERAKLAGGGAEVAKSAPASAGPIREGHPGLVVREGEAAVEGEGTGRPGLEQHQPRQRVRGLEASPAKRRRETVEDHILGAHHFRHDIPEIQELHTQTPATGGAAITVQHADTTDSLAPALGSHADQALQPVRHRVAETRLEQGERSRHACRTRLVARDVQHALHTL